MSSVRSRVEALERRLDAHPLRLDAHPLLAGFPTDPNERAELLTRIRAEREARRKSGGIAERIQAQIMSDRQIEPRHVSGVAKERAEILQLIREARARRVQAVCAGTT